jgi:hypothetical protein
MSETKKITIGVLGGISGIAALFAIVLMLAGKGDEPAPRRQLLLAEAKAKPPAPATAPAPPPKPAEKPLLAERPPAPAVGTQPEGAPVAQARTLGDSSPASGQIASPQPLAQTEPKGSPEAGMPAPEAGTRTEPKAASAPAVADQSPAPTGGTPNGTTAAGIPTYVGPRGGVYHYSKSGKKVYERSSSSRSSRHR